MSAETGEGDDALALCAAKMAGSEPNAPPGNRASYSQVGYNLAGRVIEKVTGLTFERAVAVLSNAGPDGGLAVNQAVVRWALEHYLDVTDRGRQSLPNDPAGRRRSPGSAKTT